MLEDDLQSTCIGRDAVVYGCMCALASQSRQELRHNILENSSVRGNLSKLAPEWLTIIQNFASSNYSACFTTLNSMTNERLLDLHIGEHW